VTPDARQASARRADGDTGCHPTPGRLRPTRQTATARRHPTPGRLRPARQTVTAGRHQTPDRPRPVRPTMSPGASSRQTGFGPSGQRWVTRRPRPGRLRPARWTAVSSDAGHQVGFGPPGRRRNSSTTREQAGSGPPGQQWCRAPPDTGWTSVHQVDGGVTRHQRSDRLRPVRPTVTVRRLAGSEPADDRGDDFGPRRGRMQREASPAWGAGTQTAESNSSGRRPEVSGGLRPVSRGKIGTCGTEGVR
jgi:hypothetical protein